MSRGALLILIALSVALGCGTRDDDAMQLTSGAAVASTGPADQPPVAVWARSTGSWDARSSRRSD